MKLKKCLSCDTYTLEETCQKCGKPSSNAHYKYLEQKKDNSENPEE